MYNFLATALLAATAYALPVPTDLPLGVSLK